MPTTLFEKIWSRHAIFARPDGTTLLHVGRHLIHDGSVQPFRTLNGLSLAVRRPERTFATADHYVATSTQGRVRSVADIDVPERRAIVSALSSNTAQHGIAAVFGLDDVRQGIVHVVGPEQGITLPGLLMVCGDSHTATHGALGALAFGIGSSEVTHVLATQTLWQSKPLTMRVTVDGALGRGVTAKDVIMAVIAQIGAAGGTGHVIEYAGSTIHSMSIEGRMTACNMSIEAGARAGMVAPDDTTFAYLAGRPYAPHADLWDQAIADWRNLRTDSEARFDREVFVDATAIAPMVTWGTSPEDALPITGRVPDPADVPSGERRDSMVRKLEYMGLTPGAALDGVSVDRVFIGSCTNGRIEDLRAAASVVRGRRAVVPTMVVPGSSLVRSIAEAEGLDQVFRAAGFEWRQSGCSMCVGMNGDTVGPGERCASTSNRNFVGRQGKEARTHLVSPAMAVAAAVTGRLSDVRRLMVA